MVSAADQLHKAEEHSRSTLAFFVVCAAAWALFVVSSFNYRAEPWFLWLFAGRVLLIAGAVFAGALAWFVPRLAKHSELSFSLLCLAMQVSCGILEASGSVEFYNFASVFILMVAIFSRLDFRSWLKFAYLPAFALSLLPLFFKNASIVGSLGSVVDKLSPVVASLAIGFVIGRSTSIKNEVLAKNKQLQKELTHERDQQREIIEQQLRELSAARVSDAIAKAAQMLAHDVRKPLSMIRMTVDGLARATSSEQIQRIAQTALPETNAALNQADALIRDVLEVSAPCELQATAFNTASVVHDVVSTLGKTSPHVQVNVALGCDSLVQADAARIQRVFENILTNACEAMNGSGKIEVSCEQAIVETKTFVRFRIWNSGPAIADADASKLFDLFFTKGKSGGTGLGLAIAHKIVTEHGGRIWCESSLSQGAAFCFEIPASSENVSESAPVVLSNVRSGVAAAVMPQVRVSGELVTEAKELRAVFVDDDAIFCMPLEMMLQELCEATGTILVGREASNATEAHNAIAELNPDIVFLDIDLGYNSASGLDVLAELRKAGNNVFVCVHSNRPTPNPEEFAREHGANVVAQKPMTREKMISILEMLNALRRQKQKDERFALVDDSAGTCELWTLGWPKGTLDTFATPEEFWAKVKGDAKYLASLSAVFTDLNFEEASATKGTEFASRLRREFGGAIFVTTDACVAHAHGLGAENGTCYKIIPKGIPSADFLERL